MGPGRGDGGYKPDHRPPALASRPRSPGWRDGLSPGPRRHPGPGSPGRPALPRRSHLDARRISRRRRLLRTVRLPHHDPDRGGVQPLRSHQLQALLSRPRATPAPRPATHARHRRNARGLRLSRLRRAVPRRCHRVALLRHQLVVCHLRRLLLRGNRQTALPAAPVVTGRGGAVLPPLAGTDPHPAPLARPSRGVLRRHRRRPGLDRMDGFPRDHQRLPAGGRPQPRVLRLGQPHHGPSPRCGPGDGLEARAPLHAPHRRRQGRRHRCGIPCATHRPVLLLAGGRVLELPLPGWIPRALRGGVRAHRRRQPPGRPLRQAHRHTAVALHRPALLRPLPLPLAHLRHHTSRTRCAT